MLESYQYNQANAKTTLNHNKGEPYQGIGPRRLSANIFFETKLQMSTRKTDAINKINPKGSIAILKAQLIMIRIKTPTTQFCFKKTSPFFIVYT
ncbi:hypothetical protein GCM10009123_21120 [Kangiella japonica]|uniref:Uncharacterized protein n=1 Tax=Kangiella japonica TaxID=647384 RepID=A0ABN0T6Q2_9GAMM